MTTRRTRRTLTYSLWSLLPFIAVLIPLGILLGRPGLIVAGLLALPWFAWRYDNETGTFLPLAVLALFPITVLALLLFLIALAFGPLGRS